MSDPAGVASRSTDLLDPSFKLLLETLRNHTDPRPKHVQTSLVFRAIFAFFTLPTSKERLMAVENNLSTCRCNLADPFMQGLHSSSEAYGHFIFNLATILSTAFIDLPPGRFRSRIRTRDVESQPWPLSPAELFAEGGTSQDSLAGLMLWAEAIPSGAGSFMVMADLLARSPSLGRTFLTNPLALRLATDHLKLALWGYEAFPGRAPSFLYPIVATSSLFSALHGISPFSLVSTALDPVFDELLSVSTRLRTLETTDPKWVTVLGGLHYLLERKQDLKAGVQRVLSDEELHKSAILTMLFFRLHHKCMHIGCPSQSAKKTLQCAQCAIVRYCGSDCQRKAWRDPVLPHKRLCTAVQSMRRALELDDVVAWSQWVSITIAEAKKKTPRQFAVLCSARGVDPALSRIIHETLSELTMKLSLDGV
ncbi:hypothetical protein MSAN_00776900 [Mycena sanguinolenta]|uniref:MYND-type domain-containing protein n=1 Tax=Mycena sanguinolenta TaxID=230812 RepID=A0A8H6Z2G7_9AGAR|nr:hypothetical protein MSAN_00776900 [Mycena sanguinolenta]